MDKKKTIALLKQFHGASNKSILHPADDERFDKFINKSFEEKTIISKTEFFEILGKKTKEGYAGFDSETIRELYTRYKTALELLEKPVNTRPQ